MEVWFSCNLDSIREALRNRRKANLIRYWNRESRVRREEKKKCICPMCVCPMWNLCDNQDTIKKLTNNQRKKIKMEGDTREETWCIPADESVCVTSTQTVRIVITITVALIDTMSSSVLAAVLSRLSTGGVREVVVTVCWSKQPLYMCSSEELEIFLTERKIRPALSRSITPSQKFPPIFTQWK